MKKCQCCDTEKSKVERRRTNTAYVKEESNFIESYKECYDEACEHYADLWAQYYADYL